MPVVIACPTCQQKVRVNENLIGKSVKCPQCRNPFVAVDPNALQTPGPTWEPPAPSSDLDFTSQPPPPEQPPRANVFEPESQPFIPSEKPRSTGGGGKTVVDYLLFRRMVTPGVIIVLFYMGVVGIVIGGLAQVVSGLLLLIRGSVLGLLAILGALVGTLIFILLWRVYCEVVAVLFRIFDQLRELNEKTPPRSEV